MCLYVEALFSSFPPTIPLVSDLIVLGFGGLVFTISAHLIPFLGAQEVSGYMLWQHVGDQGFVPAPHLVHALFLIVDINLPHKQSPGQLLHLPRGKTLGWNGLPKKSLTSFFTTAGHLPVTSTAPNEHRRQTSVQSVYPATALEGDRSAVQWTLFNLKKTNIYWANDEFHIIHSLKYSTWNCNHRSDSFPIYSASVSHPLLRCLPCVHF